MNNVAANILYNAIMPGKLNIYFIILLFFGGQISFLWGHKFFKSVSTLP